jgi:Membrane protein involved in the export of O-antigen and teichoic acid
MQKESKRFYSVNEYLMSQIQKKSHNYNKFPIFANRMNFQLMQNRFLKNIIFLLFLNLLIKPFWIFGVDRSVQNLIGDSAYGLYNSIFSFSYLFYILLDLGITNFNTKNIAQNNQLLSKHFISISQVKLFLAFVYTIVLFSIGLIIGYRGFSLTILTWCCINQILLSFILYLRSNISGLLLFKTDSFLSVFDRLLAIIVCSIILWGGFLSRENFSIMWYIYAQTFAYACTVILALTIVIKHTHKLNSRLNIPFCLMILKKSLPYALLVLLMSFYNRLEPVLLERLLDDNGYQSGIYNRAFRLLDAGNNISYLFSVILLPLFAATLKKGEDLRGLVKLSFSIIFSMTSVAAILGIFYSREIMELLYEMQSYETLEMYRNRILQSSQIFQILMGSFVAVSTTYIFGTLLTANGNLKYLNIVAASGVVINLVLNFIFIPKFESVGAAYTSLCVQSITAFIQYLIAENVFKVKLNGRFWLHILFFLLLTATSTYIIKTINSPWLFTMAISLTVNIILIFVTKLLNIKELISFIMSKEKNMD